MERDLSKAEFLMEDGHHGVDQDIAEDGLDNIIRLKEELIELMDRMVRAGADAHDVAGMEDSFDDAMHGVWREKYEAGVSPTYSTVVPSCDEVRTLMKRAELRKRLRPVPTNPATTGEL